ncbi:MAG: hypothetical protein FWF15_08205 [Oscillospiraceae bacterium]|nr:hypothetical protein [Oscillospiraceae bacterium]
MKKIAFLICLTFIFTFIVGCSGDTETPVAKNETAVGLTASDIYNTDYLPEYNLGDRNFNILTWGYPDGIRGQDLGNFFDANEENGDPINDAIYLRNMTVTERFNFKMNVMFFNNADYTTKLNNTIMANDKEFDLFVMHTAQNTQIALKGNMVINWNDIRCVDLSKPWWNQSIRELIDINGFLPVMVSDYLYSSLVITYAMIYSKNMLENYKLESIYKMVDDSRWTFDNFNIMVKPLTMDLNGDGIMDNNDQYGYSTNLSTHLVALSYGSGIRSISLDKNGIPNLSLYSEKSVKFVEKLYDMFYTDKIIYTCQNNVICPISWDADQVFIQAIYMTDLAFYRMPDADFGVIPFPKWDESQAQYHTFTDGMGGVLAIPVYTDDPEMVGAIVEALSAESRRTLLPAYYDRTLNTKFVRDEESTRMLDIIFAGRVYDFGYVYRNPTDLITSYIQTLITEKNKNLTSYYESKKDMWTEWFNDIYEIYMEIST